MYAPLLASDSASEIKDRFQKALMVKIFQFAAALQLPVLLISTLMSPAVAPLMLFIVFVPWALVVLRALCWSVREARAAPTLPVTYHSAWSVFQVLHVTPGLPGSTSYSCFYLGLLQRTKPSWGLF